MLNVPVSQAHSKLLNKAAKEVLAPEGVFQKGRSRTWIDDHGWWIINIEFQPSSWSKGSYLNVGAMWLWVEKDYFSFDDGYRVADFIGYVNDDQFAPEARKLALAACKEMLKLRERFATIHLAARYLLHRLDELPGNPWAMFHAGMSLGCIGEISQARACFERIEALKADREWETRLQDTARKYAAMLDGNTEFLPRVREAIFTSRSLLRLPQRNDIGL